MTIMSSALFTDLSTQDAQTVQGGRRHHHRSFDSFFRPVATPSYPDYNYGGNTGYSGNAINQSVNVNVLYDD